MVQKRGSAAPHDWTESIGEEVERSSWDECLNLLLFLGHNNIIYRGHQCFDWKLESTLERALQDYAEKHDKEKYELINSACADRSTDEWANNIEKYLTESFRRNALRFDIPDLPPVWDTLGWWEVMQHHGAPTRLMDWSRSLFTALWFALEQHNDGCGDMALWVYDIGHGYLNHRKAISKVRSADDFEIIDDRRRQNQFVQLVLKDGNPMLFPVTPRQFPRSVAQQSILTVSPNIGVNRPANWWIRKKFAIRIQLREEWKEQMWASCRSMGLSRPGLFRDLDSLGVFVNESFLNQSDIPEIL